MAITDTARRALVAVFADAVEEDRTVLSDLLVALAGRFTAFELVEPTVMGPWIETEPTYAFRYVVSVGGTGPVAGLEVEVKTGETIWRAYASDGTGDPHEIGSGFILREEAIAAADAWAIGQGWRLA